MAKMYILIERVNYLTTIVFWNWIKWICTCQFRIDIYARLIQSRTNIIVLQTYLEHLHTSGTRFGT